MKIQHIKNSPKAAGKRELLKHMSGVAITRSAAMAAKCFECCNGFIDGRLDCRISDCPLYPWMPYNKASHTATDTEANLLAALSEPSEEDKDANIDTDTE